MSRYRLYPKSKPSGVDWLGNVPNHWGIKRIGHYFDERKETVSDRDFPPLSVTMNGIVPQLEGVAKTEDNDNRKKVCVGDLVINSRSDRKGSSGLSVLDGSVSVINTVLRPAPEVYGKFVHYLLRSVAFQEEFYRVGNGLVADLWSTRYSEMKNIKLAMPPYSEQKAIAESLDRETARLDSLVARKERFIGLLCEKRQALITHAVTKGLNSHVRMKDSGVEWIGRIPNHWRIGNIKMLLAEVEYGLSEAASDFGDVEFLTMGNVQNGEVIRTRQKFLSDVPKHMLLREGDILFNRTNSLDLVGKVGIFRERESDPVTFASYLVRLRCKEQINPEYLTYYLGCDPFLAVARTMALPSVSQANLNPNRYGFLPAPIPPKKEQDAIVDVIAASEKRLKHLVSKTQTSIDLLKERRSALITAAVTGQIDLREAS